MYPSIQQNQKGMAAGNISLDLRMRVVLFLRDNAKLAIKE